MPELRLIDSHDLVLSPSNPRTTEPSDQEVAALAGSIAELGLLQNLIGLDRGDLVEIVGGGLRLRALLTLPSQEVDVLVFENADEAIAAALAENEVRREMGPVDRFRAFLALTERGRSAPQIARAYATDTAEVARILALRVCAPEVLEALEAGRIDLDRARAFTVTQDHARQREVLASSEGRWAAGAIRRNLRDRDDRLEIEKAARFVGLDVYEAAGGALTRDLFSDEVWIDDPTLLFSLRDQRLKAAAESEEAAGWSWAIVSGAADDMVYIHPGPSPDPLTEEEAERFEELTEAHPEQLTEEERAELVGLQARVDRESSGVFSPDQMSVAGVIIRLGWGDDLAIDRGLVRPEDKARAIELGVLAPAEVSGAEQPAAEDEAGSGLPASLVADLHGLRAIAVQCALAQSPERALDVLAWHLAGGSKGLVGGSLRPGETANGASLGLEPPTLGATRGVGGFAEFAARGKKARNAVLAAEVARSFGMGWSDQAQMETAAIAEALGIDMRKIWTPPEAFFRRLKTAQLEELFQELTGHPPSAIYASYKKADLVSLLTDLFDGPGNIAEALRGNNASPAPDLVARVKAWLPAPIRPAAEPVEGAAPAAVTGEAA